MHGEVRRKCKERGLGEVGAQAASGRRVPCDGGQSRKVGDAELVVSDEIS